MYNYYTLAVNINDRRFYLSKLKERLESTLNIPSTFIVKNNGEAILFSIKAYTRDKNLQFSDGYKNDEGIHTIGVVEMANDSIRICINDSANVLDHSHNTYLVYNKKKHTYDLVIKNEQLGTKKIEVSFVNKYKRRYTGHFNIHLVSAYEKVRLALDFGSDTSQARYAYYDQSYQPEDDSKPVEKDVKLYSILKRRYKKELDDDIDPSGKAKYFQFANTQDPSDNERFLRSIFYWNKNKKIEDIDYLSSPIEKNDDFIKMLSGYYDSDIDSYQRIPNTKLVELAPKEIFDFGLFNENGALEKLQIAIICRLLHLCLDGINKELKRKSFAIQLILLIPNVYPQEKVHRIIRALNKYLYQIIKKHPEYNTQAIEVTTISESDASFKGIWPQINHTENEGMGRERYLVIDSGQGTTDLSILETVPNSMNQFISIYKAGIPAAGQYLSFAIIQALSKALKMKSINEFIDYFFSSDNVLLDQQIFAGRKIDFLNKIDKIKALSLLKIGNERGNTSILEDFRRIQYKQDGYFESLSESVLSKLIKEKQIINDSHYYVGRAIAKICQIIVNRINDLTAIAPIKFDKIIFAGRAFKYKPFKIVLEQILQLHFSSKTYIHDKKKLFVDNEQYNFKRICLIGALSKDVHINFSANVAGALILNPGQGRTLFGKIFTRPQKLYSLSEDFYNGLDSSNGYTPFSRDHYWIGNLKYKRVDPKNFFRKAIEEEHYLRICLEQSGYIIRLKRSPFLKLEHQFFPQRELFLKSLFPLAKLHAIKEINVEIENNDTIKAYVDIYINALAKLKAKNINGVFYNSTSILASYVKKNGRPVPKTSFFENILNQNQTTTSNKKSTSINHSNDQNNTGDDLDTSIPDIL